MGGAAGRLRPRAGRGPVCPPIREPGSFNGLEVLRAATLYGAEALGKDAQIGSIRPGKLADRKVTAHNPLENFKVLCGTGHFRLDEDSQPARLGGVRCTIKDGVVYDARELLEDVRRIVQEARDAAGPGLHPEGLPYVPEQP